MGPRSELLKFANQTKLVVNGAKTKKVKICTQFVMLSTCYGTIPNWLQKQKVLKILARLCDDETEV